MKSKLIGAALSIAMALGHVATQDARAGEVATIVPEQKPWQISANSDLKQVLDQWSRSVGWQLVWNSPHDIRIQTRLTLNGSFEEVVSQLMGHLYESRPELNTTLFHGNQVLLVTTARLVG